MNSELAIGSVGISLLLTILLRMIYNSFEVNKKLKPWIAVGIGMLLSLIAMYITEGYSSCTTAAQYLVQGFMVGATAVGFHEMTKNVN